MHRVRRPSPAVPPLALAVALSSAVAPPAAAETLWKFPTGG